MIATGFWHFYYKNTQISWKSVYDKLSPIEQKQVDTYPKYTKDGYALISFPKNIKSELTNFWKNNQQHKIPEDIPKDFIWGSKNSGPIISNILELETHNKQLYEKIILTCKNLCEKWTNNYDLRFTTLYGIREYKRGAILKMHVDAINTHVISVIIHIDNKVDKNWPLVIFDPNTKKEKKIYLDNNIDCVLYESGRIIHGRPNELIGDSYANLFAHFSTSDFTY